MLRRHLAEILRCPIVGDGRYGSTEGEDDRYGKLPDAVGGPKARLHLHCRSASFSLAGANIGVSAALPPHMERTWASLFPAAHEALLESSGNAAKWEKLGGDKRRSKAASVVPEGRREKRELGDYESPQAAVAAAAAARAAAGGTGRTEWENM